MLIELNEKVPTGFGFQKQKKSWFNFLPLRCGNCPS